ncbi:hypothetical protein WM28_28585 [Burkholderia ubonensis]|nr:hypothetical protein WM28_28585 [Burkholderia ubonensis]
MQPEPIAPAIDRIERPSPLLTQLAYVIPIPPVEHHPESAGDSAPLIFHHAPQTNTVMRANALGIEQEQDVKMVRAIPTTHF